MTASNPLVSQAPLVPTQTHHKSTNPIARAWRWWFSPRAENKEDAFSERAIRMLIPVLSVFYALSYVDLFTRPGVNLERWTMFSPVIDVAIIVLFFVLSVYGVMRGNLNVAGFGMSGAGMVAVLLSILGSGYWETGSVISAMLLVALAALFLGGWQLVVFSIVVSALFAVMGTMQEAEGFLPPLRNGKMAITPISMAVTVFGSVGILMALLIVLKQEYRKRVQEVVQLVSTLEQRVADRTRDLQVAADVSRQVTTILDQHELLNSLVERTRQGFGLYQVSVYLLKADSNTLFYEAGTGDAGRQMKKIDKQFTLDSSGLVPHAGSTGQPVLANDVRQNSDFSPNPFLPDTRAELALPMMLGGQLIGVLDLQSDELNRFTKDDLVVLTALAEQLAVAVQNARFYGEQLQIAEQLRAVDTMKSQFLASMSHELRTPLNAILNFTEFVALGLLGTVNDAQKDALDKSLESGKHLLSLINDVLDITKIESGMMNLFVENDIVIANEVKTVIAAMQALLKDKQVQWVEDIDTDLPNMTGDRRRIRQILLNLLSNAAKFTEEGSITFSVKKQGEDLLFAVIDTGPGIAPDEQEMIFEPFRQTDAGIQHAGGTGLGLPISKRLAEAHGGRLWVESQKGEGAAFYVKLPVMSPTLVDAVPVA